MGTIPEFTKEEALYCIREAILNAYSKFATNEGIDIDLDNRIVLFNPNHEENVATSIENNSTFSKEFGSNVIVWPIFKRKQSPNTTDGDGNPLLYALKNEKGWKISRESFEKITHNLIEILKKFKQYYNGGITILIPSGNYLNQWFANLVKEAIRMLELLIMFL